MSTAQEKGVRDVVGIHALFEVNKKVAAVKPVMPFSTAMGKDTMKKYCGYWERLLCYLYRTQEIDEFVAKRRSYIVQRFCTAKPVDAAKTLRCGRVPRTISVAIPPAQIHMTRPRRTAISLSQSQA